MLSALRTCPFGPPAARRFSSMTFGTWQTGAVMPMRAGARPVRMLARVGEQSGLAE